MSFFAATLRTAVAPLVVAASGCCHFEPMQRHVNNFDDLMRYCDGFAWEWRCMDTNIYATSASPMIVAVLPEARRIVITHPGRNRAMTVIGETTKGDEILAIDLHPSRDPNREASSCTTRVGRIADDTIEWRWASEGHPDKVDSVRVLRKWIVEEDGFRIPDSVLISPGNEGRKADTKIRRMKIGTKCALPSFGKSATPRRPVTNTGETP